MATPDHHRAGLERDPDALWLAGNRAGTAGNDGLADARAQAAEGRLRRLLRINKRLNSELRLPRLLEMILDTVIPRDQTFLEASLRGAPLLLMQKRPPPLARIFDQLATELFDRMEPEGGATKEEDDGPIPLLV